MHEGPWCRHLRVCPGGCCTSPTRFHYCLFLSSYFYLWMPCNTYNGGITNGVYIFLINFFFITLFSFSYDHALLTSLYVLRFSFILYFHLRPLSFLLFYVLDSFLLMSTRIKVAYHSVCLYGEPFSWFLTLENVALNCPELQFWLKSDKRDGYSTFRPLYTSTHISSVHMSTSISGEIQKNVVSALVLHWKEVCFLLFVVPF
jgi:hypothetical protein